MNTTRRARKTPRERHEDAQRDQEITETGEQSTREISDRNRTELRELVRSSQIEGQHSPPEAQADSPRTGPRA